MVQFVHCKFNHSSTFLTRPPIYIYIYIYIYVCMYLIKLLLFSSEGSEA